MPAKKAAAAAAVVVSSVPGSSAPSGGTSAPDPLLEGGNQPDADVSTLAEALAVAANNDLLKAARVAAERMAAEGQAIAAATAEARASRIALLVKQGMAAKTAEKAALEKAEKDERDRLAASAKVERDRVAALDKATREALEESNEVNAAIIAGIAEADRVLALQVLAVIICIALIKFQTLVFCCWFLMPHLVA